MELFDKQNLLDADRELTRLLAEFDAAEYRVKGEKEAKLMSWPMKPHEAILLFGLIMLEQPDVVFESGTAVGWSSSWMALASQAPVFTFDPVVRVAVFRSHVRVAKRYCEPFESGVVKLLNTSDWKGKKKLFMIDGDHTKEGAIADFTAIEPYVERGDLIVYHDTSFEFGVRKAVKHIVRKYPHWDDKRIITVNGMHVITVT